MADDAAFAAEEFSACDDEGESSQRSQISMHALLQMLTPPVKGYARTHDMLLKVSRLASTAASGRRAMVVAIGTREVPGARAILAQGGADVVQVAINPGAAESDLACDFGRLPFQDGTADALVIVDSLHRSLDPVSTAREAVRILRSKGVLYVEEPCVEPVTKGPDDFYRFTGLGLRGLFRDCEELASGMTNGPGAALALAWRHFLWSIPQSRRWGLALATLGSLSSFFLRRADAYLEKRSRATDAAATVFFLGQRASATMSVPELLASYKGAAAGAPGRGRRIRPPNEVFTKWAAEGLDIVMQKNHDAAVGEMLAAAYSALGASHGITAVDAGCGNGWIVRRLQESGRCLRAVGVDGSAGMIARARSIDPDGRYEIADLTKWEPSEPVDLVISMEVLYYLDDPVLLLRRIATIWLKPTGYAVFGIDHYEENGASLRWPTGIGVRMTTWSQARWRLAMEESGFDVRRSWRAAARPGEPGTLAMLVQPRSGRNIVSAQATPGAGDEDAPRMS